MLWSEVEVEIGDPKNKAERIKFKHISLIQVLILKLHHNILSFLFIYHSEYKLITHITG